MDPLLMVGAWSAAVMSVVAAARFFYTLLLRGLRSVIKDELSAVWVDMQAAEDRFGHIEERLDRLEVGLGQLRDQVQRLTELLMAHTTEMSKRHDRV